MLDLRVSQLAASLHQVVFLYLALLLEVKVLEHSLHLFKEAAVHENGADATEELIKVDIFFLTLVEQGEDAFKNLRWVLEAEHLDNLDEIEALDARRPVLLLKEGVRVEHVVLERFHVHTVQSDQPIGSHDIDT